jgi:hypothetical protein
MAILPYYFLGGFLVFKLVLGCPTWNFLDVYLKILRLMVTQHFVQSSILQTNVTKQVDRRVMLQICVREVFYSILGQVTDDSEGCRCFTQSLSATAGMMP